jgi:RNA-directed DNA polymerase
VSEAKPFQISKRRVWDAYKRVKANRGAAGVDGETLSAFEEDLKDNLYKLWNRMSSGSYFPPPVRLVEIPKGDGGRRALGIPTVADRIAQTVVTGHLEAEVEPEFHPDSYGYRPGRSAHDALATARKRCWEYDWAIDLDIKGFFDNLDHELLMRAVRKHTDEAWIHLYVERWLRAPVQAKDGNLQERTRGTPQGGVVSPLLANLFLHYAFDMWMVRTHPGIPFERYADDILVHCASQAQAAHLLVAIGDRLKQCGLDLHPTKCRIVYCKDDNRRGQHEHISFDFLGYTFRPRTAMSRWGKYFVGFLPAMSPKAAKAIRATMRAWRLARRGNTSSLEEIAQWVNPFVRGWINYYGRFHRSALSSPLNHLDRLLVRWACRKYKRFRGRPRRATAWLRRIAGKDPGLFAHWQFAAQPRAGQ